MKRLLAAITFFTRIPLYKWVNIPSDCFKKMVEWWPLAGWLTGGVMAAVYYFASMAFPQLIAIILALLARLVLTGALHEDGLADFCDGMGCGEEREKILAIMKDSHIGTFGVIGLIFYFMLLIASMGYIHSDYLPIMMIAADAGSKFFAAQTINFLPYARTVEEAKNKTIYDRMSVGGFILALVAGLLPAMLLPHKMWWAYIAPAVVTAIILRIEKKKINGYTGDCCGATFLLAELSFYIVAILL